MTGPVKSVVNLLLFGLFALFVAVSALFGYEPGIDMGWGSWRFLKTMLLMFPGAFILIGLFDAWVDRSIVERHLGDRSGILGYFWMIVLATSVMAPLVVALPIARSLSDKGARLSLVLTFLGASTVFRIPMSVFEAGYLGLPFTLVRLGVSLPLIIIFAELIGRSFRDIEPAPIQSD